MRALHVQKVSGIGGSERHLLTLLPGLAEAGVEVRMLVAATEQANRFTEPLSSRGIPVKEVRAGPHFNPLLAAALIREIRGFRPDLVHTHLIHADLHGQPAAALARVTGVSSVHGTPGFYDREPYRTAHRLTGRLAGRTIAISEHVRRFLEERRLSRPERIDVVPYGIDAAQWPLPGVERERVRQELGLAHDDVAVGIASRLIPGKGHAALIDAHAAAVGQDRRLRLLVAGDGPIRAELEHRAARAGDGSVRFLDFVADIRGFMNACDIVAFPTEPALGEGFGLAALEAMASARPVVATAVGSLPELVRPRDTGVLVDPGAIGELAAALVELAGDASLRADMGARAEERARAVFSVEAMVERTLGVYRRGLGG
jgi:glycosyltransferase involved in cell wall biosynthesis